MRNYPFWIALLILVSAPAAADIPFAFEAPEASRVRTDSACNIVRQQMRKPLAKWDRDQCGLEIFRRGRRAILRAAAKQAATVTLNIAEQTDVNLSDAEFPRPVRSYCGDGVLQSEWEECDDGNDDAGDGCDSNCLDE